MLQIAWCSRILASPFAKSFVKYFIKYLISLLSYLCLSFSLLLFSETAQAADLHTVLRNLRGVIVPLTSMVLVISFVAGIVMIFRALALMKKFGTMMTMQSQPGELGGPLVYLIVGAVLVYLPTSTDYLMNSLFEGGRSLFGAGGGIDYTAFGQGASILGYSGSATFEAQWADLANTLVLYIQFIGFLSFVKGWFIIAKAGQPGTQPGTISKGITHLIGGIIAINFVGFVDIIRNTIVGTQ